MRGRSRGDWVGRRQGIREEEEEATAASAGGRRNCTLRRSPFGEWEGGEGGGERNGFGGAGRMSRVLTGGETENLLKGGGGDVPTGEEEKKEAAAGGGRGKRTRSGGVF